MEATFDSTKLTIEREVYVVCSILKVITDMSSDKTKQKQIVAVVLGREGG